jgi:lipopolysaccharide biosynthesis glycosyltransferase
MKSNAIRVFIGYDPQETIAYHVLANSIMRQSSKPVTITPLILSQLPLTRPREETQSTEFAFSRFLVPWLCDYEGKAIFMDCDMLCRMDIADLFKQTTDYNAQVSVVKHHYTPKDDDKFLGNKQTRYDKKNWSSLMIFNNPKCRVLTPEIVNEATGMYLHQFQWADEVAEIPKAYNHLVGEYEKNPFAKIVHFTLGTPCFPKYADCEFAQEWRDEKRAATFHETYGEFGRAERHTA